MTLKTRIIPCLDVKDCTRRPQRLSREDAQTKDSAVR
jgi:imidazole glycerol phosphate synthase subunit HisF